ncbi:hypothetical protein N7507_004919 [Penicillium longicatenatum]|nr:hypothetical protein N7507_004919 [Penicillium longicatenatum]
MSTDNPPGVPVKLEDVIEGKGGGLVLLFYGAPGVGKSLTAESIAKYTGKPLLKVSVADFGTDVSLVEGKLEETFQIASRWRAVLLFDEADVFLEARATEGNLDRNAMASVFLKVLEYYQGILILTTNRVRTFDIAVQSRVHLAVRFKDFVATDQKKIFEMFLNKMTSDVVDRKNINTWLDERFEDHGSRNGEQLNGRQIRNILSSAVALARSEKKKLQLSHIKTMWHNTIEFQTHLHDQTILAKQRNE